MFLSIHQSMNSTQSLADLNPQALKLWVPVDALIAGDRPAIEWMELRGVEFKEPFFNETLAKADSNAKRSRVVTDIHTLLQFESICEGLSPAGFIFHCSRCGSSLVANVCRALKGSLVIAEAPAIDKLISRFFTDAPPGSARELLYLLLLRASVSALGQRLTGDESRYFVKLACTSTLQVERIRRVWPDVPFVFLYRDPVEVIVSNLKSTPEWMQPESNRSAAAAIVGVTEDQLASLTAEEYCARSLGRFFSAVDANFDTHIKLVNYAQLGHDSLIEILKFFGIEPTENEIDEIQKVSRLYSKDLTRTKLFEEDSSLKRFAASQDAFRMSETWAQSAYNRLNARALS